MKNLKIEFRRIVASYLRAVAGTVAGTQIFDAFDARGWNGVLVSLLISLIPPTIRAIEAIAKDLDGE